VIRPQYHLRQSERGLLAWDVRRLVDRARNLPVVEIALTSIREIDEAYWYANAGASPTCRDVVEHCALIEAADLAHPIILDSGGRVMDGMHRICKALLRGLTTIEGVRFEQDPEPDFVGVDEADLPYDDAGTPNERDR